MRRLLARLLVVRRLVAHEPVPRRPRACRPLVVPRPLPRRPLARTFLLLVAIPLLIGSAPAPALSSPGVQAVPTAPISLASQQEFAVAGRWAWPVAPPWRILNPYRAPAGPFAAGHRGIDLEAAPGTIVLTPADGVVRFAGTVVDRPLITIGHGGTLISTLEPVVASVAAGTVVHRGEPIGTVASGGHTASGALHLGARLGSGYVNPLLFLGGVPRAVLLPTRPAP